MSTQTMSPMSPVFSFFGRMCRSLFFQKSLLLKKKCPLCPRSARRRRDRPPHDRMIGCGGVLPSSSRGILGGGGGRGVGVQASTSSFVSWGWTCGY